MRERLEMLRESIRTRRIEAMQAAATRRLRPRTARTTFVPLTDDSTVRGFVAV